MSPRYLFGQWARSRALAYSGKSRFVQRGYPKKARSQPASDWRQRKGFARDQAKHSCWCKLGRYLKTVDHRARRAYEREMIGRQDWDRMTDHKSMFVSSYDAC